MHRITWPAIADRFGMNDFMTIDPARTALIVIDMQLGFLEPGFPGYGPHAIDIVPNINMLAAALRAAGGTVVFTRHTVYSDPDRAPPRWQIERPEFTGYFDSLRENAPGHPLHASLDIQSADLLLDKVWYSAFLPHSSTLDADLKARGIDTVIITGVVTNICCESSARDAHMMGYRVFVIADANAAATDDAHNASLATLGLVFADVRLTEEMLPLITAPGCRPRDMMQRAGADVA